MKTSVSKVTKDCGTHSSKRHCRLSVELKVIRSMLKQQSNTGLRVWGLWMTKRSCKHVTGCVRSPALKILVRTGGSVILHPYTSQSADITAKETVPGHASYNPCQGEKPPAAL